MPTKHWGHPYTSIVAREKGDKGTFLLAEQNYQIDGKWGYREVTENSGSLINDASGISSTGTSLTMDDGTDFQIGQTIKIESEQLLVTNIATNVLTVVRALNGTSGVSHVDDEQVDILRWPLAVERATLITAARLWKRAPSFEPFYVDADVDTDVRLLLDAYRSIAV